MVDFLKQWGIFAPSLTYGWLIVAFGFAYANSRPILPPNQKRIPYLLSYAVNGLVLLMLGYLSLPNLIGSTIAASQFYGYQWISYVIYLGYPIIYLIVGIEQFSNYEHPVDFLFFRKPVKAMARNKISVLSSLKYRKGLFVLGITIILAGIGLFSLSLQTCWVLDSAIGHSGCIREIVEKSNTIESVQFSPDGKQLAIAGSDEMLRLVDVKTGELIRELKGHNDTVSKAVFSPNGNLLASASWDGTVRLWKPDDGSLLHTFEVAGVRDNPKIGLGISLDDTNLAISGYNGSIKIWNTSDYSLVRELPSSSKRVVFSPDGALIALDGPDNTIRLWQIRDGKFLSTFKISADGISNLIFSPDGQQIATVSGTLVKLWRVSDSTLLHELKGYSEAVRNIAFSPDSKLLATSGVDELGAALNFNVRVWNTADGKEISSGKNSRSLIRSLAFSPDGTMLATGSSYEVVRLWRVNA